ncbi:cardiolipin synthase [Govanella unica]|uniref:Cardiolipin synthase n=1 Tax=Govanella unica TaxID=2975056 RepID=A0A9X3Z843_9PROT|nr:cardiolipin synthase [Govania unica]MDA5194852.1 cardiolipin synthase [Govania unica]
MAGFFTFWPYVVAGLSFVVSVLASCHIVLTKQNQRAAIGWLGVVWLTPLVGGMLYVAFGINRIHRRATRLRPKSVHPRAPQRFRSGTLALLPAAGGLADVVANVTALPLHSGNRVEALENGEEAYPAMLAAIEAAQSSIAFATYIFDNDVAGQAFVAALGRAVARGVAVRVLVDGMGSRYSFPTILSSLEAVGVTVKEFLPSLAPWRMGYLNLRNHRKILVLDGNIGFTGGMNIRAGHLAATAGAEAIQDLHFQIEGPVIEQFMAVFAEDWAFSSGEFLSGDDWFPKIHPVKDAESLLARGVPSGPDEDYDKLKWVLMGALAAAKRSVRIVTPYFLPDEVMIAALKLKAISGIDIHIVIPERGNLRLVEWATHGQIAQLIARGCRVWESPGPFDHSKIFLVDDGWAFVGSANWDPRSLYLNFEFNMECYDGAFVRKLDLMVARKIAGSRQLTLERLGARPLAIKLRDGLARMLSPYL